MNIKKTLLIALVITSMLPALVAANPVFDIAVQSYTPVPAEPGSYITTNIQIQNDGDKDARNAKLEFVDNYPFRVDNEASKLEEIGNLGPGEDYLAEFRVRIDDEALEGTNYLKFRYTMDGSNWFDKEIPLTISAATQKTLAVNQVNVVPEVIKPGEKADVAIKVKNMGGSSLRDVSMTINLAGTLVGTTYVDLPFAPIGSSIEKRIALLKGGESADFEFVLRSYPEAAAGIYKVPLTISYTDERGMEYSRTDLMSLIVSGESDLMIQVDSTTLKSSGGEGTILFSVTNKGFDEVKFLTLSLGEGENYHITSTSDKVYLGNVDSDDFETAEFELKITPETESITLPITIEYKDALNNKYEKTAKLTLPLDANGTAQNNSGMVIGIVIVIVLIIVFIVYRRRKKAKNK